MSAERSVAQFGAIVPVYKSREPAVGAMTYELLPVIPLPQILIGYDFDVL